MINKYNEFEIPLRLASLDLKKTFDRIKNFALFDISKDQRLPEPEIALLLNLYTNQTTYVEIGKRYPILRGVKQRDTINSLLFNAATE